MEKLLQYMEAHSDALSNLTLKIDSFDERLLRVEHNDAYATAGDSPPEPTLAEEPPPKRKPELEDHRTAPHKLILLWPSVKPLLEEAKVEHGESYVMEAEDRGILRIYTRGEGIDEHDGTQPGGPASPARSEDSENGAPSPPEGLWGTGLPHTPGSDMRRPELCEGGLKPDGSLDLDMATINKLYDSYMKHIHRMHPFLDKTRLRKIFDRFISRYSTGHPTLRKFAVDSGSDQERPLKRQRSNGTTGVGLPGQDNGHARKEITERSPGNAIIWLVLALGKICLHKGPLPGTVPDNKLNANSYVTHQLTGVNGVTSSSPISAAVRQSPISPRATPIAQPTPPSADGNHRTDVPSRRSSVDAAIVGARNLDVIPGLAYYAKAAEILGDQGDGNDLVHAQMFLLAGLYKGQLARVKESMSWISMAGRAIIMLLDRYKLYNENYWTAYGDTRKQYEKGQARIRDKRHSLIVLASWTCLQLESDILAELRLPSSGIQTIENMLLMPHNMPDKEEESYEGIQQVQQDSNDKESYDNILLYYTAQTFLRKRLNQVHKEMYGDQCVNQSIQQVRSMLSGHEETLDNWRKTLPPALRWNDDDPPPPDILDARLRAKYWGARYVINRPFLDYALHIMPHAKEGVGIEDVARDAHGNPRELAEVQLFKAIAEMGEPEIWEATQRCIAAAMHSTVAFDGVPDRLVITNIHGTAHA